MDPNALARWRICGCFWADDLGCLGFKVLGFEGGVGGGSESWGFLFGGRDSKDYSILGSMLGLGSSIYGTTTLRHCNVEAILPQKPWSGIMVMYPKALL